MDNRYDIRSDKAKGNDIVIIVCMLLFSGLLGILLINWTVR